MNDLQTQGMTLLQVAAAAGLVSALMPLLVSVVVQSRWSRPAKEMTVVLSCLVVSVMGILAAGQNPRDLAVALPVMILGTRIAYRQYWKKTGIAEWIEQATDIRQPEDPPSGGVMGA